jgi:hypothetical protein
MPNIPRTLDVCVLADANLHPIGVLTHGPGKEFLKNSRAIVDNRLQTCFDVIERTSTA